MFGVILYDIALIELSSKMKSQHFSTIQTLENVDLYDEDIVTVAGWGWTIPVKFYILKFFLSKIIKIFLTHYKINDFYLE